MTREEKIILIREIQKRIPKKKKITGAQVSGSEQFRLIGCNQIIDKVSKVLEEMEKEGGA
jgi:hypothetical protein